jgi:hypothetical protein
VSSAGEGQHRTQAEDVARRANFLGQDLLRRQETRVLARHVGGVPGPVAGQPRPVIGQHHVRGFEVAVHQARGVHVAEAFGQPGRQLQHGRNRPRPVPADRLSQRPSHDVRRGQPRLRTIEIRVDHRRRGPGIYCAGRRDLCPESGISGQLGRDRLHHDGLPARSQRKEHAAVPQLPDQAVRPELGRIVSLKRRYHPIPPQTAGTPFIGQS